MAAQAGPTVARARPRVRLVVIQDSPVQALAATMPDDPELEGDEEAVEGPAESGVQAVEPHYVRRAKRPRDVRSRTISIKRLTKRDRLAGEAEFDAKKWASYARPEGPGACEEGEHFQRPCPFVSCKHHLYLDVSAKTGAIKLNVPDLEVWEMTETCAIDVAMRGGSTLEEVGEILNLTRERVRQIEVKALAKIAENPALGRLLRELLGPRGPGDAEGKRRLPILDEPEVDEADDEEGEDE